MNLLYAYLIIGAMWNYLVVMLFVYFEEGNHYLSKPSFLIFLAVICLAWPGYVVALFVRKFNLPLWQRMLRSV